MQRPTLVIRQVPHHCESARTRRDAGDRRPDRGVSAMWSCFVKRPRQCAADRRAAHCGGRFDLDLHRVD